MKDERDEEQASLFQHKGSSILLGAIYHKCEPGKSFGYRVLR